MSAAADIVLPRRRIADLRLNEAIAEAAHATACALDDLVKAKIDAGESPPNDDLIKREAAEEAARGAAFDVVTKSVS